MAWSEKARQAAIIAKQRNKPARDAAAAKLRDVRKTESFMRAAEKFGFQPNFESGSQYAKSTDKLYAERKSAKFDAWRAKTAGAVVAKINAGVVKKALKHKGENINTASDKFSSSGAVVRRIGVALSGQKNLQYGYKYVSVKSNYNSNPVKRFRLASTPSKGNQPATFSGVGTYPGWRPKGWSKG